MTFKRILAVLAISLALCPVMGCGNLFGPSDEEVTKALVGAINGLKEVPGFQQSDAEQFRYRNTADLFNTNEEKTISQKTTFTIDREDKSLSCEGVCQFDDYADADSGNTINGTIEYQMQGSIDSRGKDVQKTFDFNLQFTGGAVESIVFTIGEDFVQKGIRPELLVNGKPYKFKDEQINDYMRLLRSLKVM
jgi:hypothetical protein